MEKLSKFLKACISGMFGAIFFKFGMQSLLVHWHLDSEFGLVQTKDYGAMDRPKLVHCSLC